MVFVPCGKLDLTNIPDDEVVAIGNKVWVKSEVEEKLYNWNNNPYVVIKFSEACVAPICSSQTDVPKTLLFASTALELNGQNSADSPSNIDSETASANSVSKSISDETPVTKLEESKKAMDALSVNDRGYAPAAVMPIAAIVPMRSNIKTYGPYASPNFNSSAGGTNIEVNTELSPWVFGSIAAMHQAGNSLVQNSNIGLTKAETGSVTIPGLPDLASLGITVGSGGPNLSNITCSFGSSGISTSYEFKTYTPKFGTLNRHYIERFKQIARNRNQQLRFLREGQISQNKISRKLNTISNKSGKNNNGGILEKEDSAKASLQRVLMGEMYDWQSNNNNISQRTVVGTNTLSKSVVEMMYDYEKKAYISLDALFGPLSMNGAGNLPRYANFDDTDIPHKTSPNLAQPPFVTGDNVDGDMNSYNLPINRDYLNPLTNPFQDEGHHHYGPGDGHVIDLVGRETQIPSSGMITNLYHPEDSERYSQDYRFLGMRGPIVLHSWGYDLNGKPIPNETDDESATKGGTFNKENLTDYFLTDWLKKPATWPAAPIDLRFDRDRGVWVSPPSYKIVIAKLTEDLSAYSSAKAKLVNKDTENTKDYGDPLYDKDGIEIAATNDENCEAFIRVVDRIGKSFTADTMVYAYYDTYLSEYIILSGESEQQIIRFKLIDVCPDIDPTPTYGDEWTEYAGFGDKYFDGDAISDSYALRIDCDGNPIRSDGAPLTDLELIDPEILAKHLIVVKGAVGDWGPSFNRIAGDVARWRQMAATGYGVVVHTPKATEAQEDPKCSFSVPCPISYLDENDESVTVDKVYEILYLESYARIIYGELTQDLYCSETKANDAYNDDQWKIDHPKGSAKITVSKFFGNAPNGKEPIYLDLSDEVVDVRVFDPFYNEDNPDTLKDSPFYGLIEGSRVIAVFNEKLKKYEIIQSDKKFSNIVRFKVIEICEDGPKEPPNPNQDPWLAAAGYLDKFPNSHILGVRIDCDGQPIDRFGEIVYDEDITNPDRAEDIFINLLDTCGRHGPAFAAYKTYQDWKSNAFTGFAAITENPVSTSCNGLGSSADQCSQTVSTYDSYDIIFLESYARFVECELTQDLYPSDDTLSEYADDQYKQDNPDGNAAASILHFYGGSPNHREPKFFNSSSEQISFRVFDPYEDITEKDKNPFSHLAAGDRVLAIFNENLKKYIIYSSISKEESSKVVKFALVTNKKSSDSSATAVLVNEEGHPINKDGQLLNETTFATNQITVYDPFRKRLPSIGSSAMSYSSGPAIGSSVFDHHINGIPTLNLDGSTGSSGSNLFGPFIGFALMRNLPIDEAQEESSYSYPPPEKIETIYEIITLERFAQYVQGKIGVTEASGGHYYGALTDYWDGRHPITRTTGSIPQGLNLIVDYYPTQMTGAQSYIVGDFKEGQTATSSDSFSVLSNKIDGCKFVAKLNDIDSFSSGENLIYQIIETETIALNGVSELKDTDTAEQLNTSQVLEDSTLEKIDSKYSQGFQWDKTDSETHYNAITIKNRSDWSGKGKIIKGCIFHTRLEDINNGDPVYRIEYGETIAKIAEKTATDGLWGTGTGLDNEYRADEKSYQGVDVTGLDNDDIPKINPLALNTEWMTYEGSATVSLWDESVGGVKGTDGYRMVFAKEAPIMIYGTAVEKFTPETTSDIQISGIAGSCHGISNSPIPTALLKVENPMGYGAEAGDIVCVNRVYIPDSAEYVVNANYKYIVVSTGAEPQTTGAGG